VCLALARKGCNIVVAAKSISEKPNLPGTIFTVAEECKQLGVQAIGVQLNVMDEDSVLSAVAQTVEKFGRIDILINNASALWWQDIKDTPLKKYNLIHSVNARGSFLMTQACLPHMSRNGFGRVLTMSPPIATKGFAGHTAYNISKMGMTMVALGVAEEYRGKGITGNSLWPATVIESQASINFKLVDPSAWRKATIIADATVGIVSEEDSFTGNMLIDDTYLIANQGFSKEDLVQYRMDPDVEPPRLLAGDEDFKTGKRAKRGDIHKLEQDLADGDFRAKL
jgi:NAD(P)-dependent dehydrogenase (short-subunit alcohol dehydrogenase family)